MVFIRRSLMLFFWKTASIDSKGCLTAYCQNQIPTYSNDHSVYHQRLVVSARGHSDDASGTD